MSQENEARRAPAIRAGATEDVVRNGMRIPPAMRARERNKKAGHNGGGYSIRRGGEGGVEGSGSHGSRGGAAAATTAAAAAAATLPGKLPLKGGLKRGQSGARGRREQGCTQRCNNGGNIALQAELQGGKAL